MKRQYLLWQEGQKVYLRTFLPPFSLPPPGIIIIMPPGPPSARPSLASCLPFRLRIPSRLRQTRNGGNLRRLEFPFEP